MLPKSSLTDSMVRSLTAVPSSRKTAITAENVKDYTNLLNTTREDLESQLELINDKLDLLGDTVATSQADAAEVKAIKDERRSTEQCLQICAQLSEQITRIQLTGTPSHASSATPFPSTLPEQLTHKGLQECKDQLSQTAQRLAQHEKVLFNRLLDRTRVAMTSQQERQDLAQLHDQWEATQQSMNICSQAFHKLRANASTIDNYAVGDAIQFMVSTDDRTVHGNNRGLGWRTRQIGGTIDPQSFQQMMKSLEIMDASVLAHPHNPAAENPLPTPKQAEQNSRFQTQYGKGFNLTSTPPGAGKSGRST